ARALGSVESKQRERPHSPTSPLPPQRGPILLALPRPVKAATSSVPDQRADRSGRPIGKGDAMVVRVGDVEPGRSGADAAGLAECGSGPRPIGAARGAAAQPGRYHAASRLEAFDLVVVTVRQEQDAITRGDPERVLEAN